jgi:hypothetical protein
MNVLHASSSISSSFRHIDICVHALHGPGHAYICTHDDRMELLSADAVEPRGAPDGAADRWRVRAAAVGAGDGGGAESLSDTVVSDALSCPSNVASYMGQMAAAMNKLSTLEGFVRQVPHGTLHYIASVLRLSCSPNLLLL